MRGAAAIGFRFRVQCLLADWTDERLVIGRDDRDPSVGDRVAPTVLFEVISDERAAWNEYVAVDDRAPYTRVPAYAHARHKNRLFDLAEAVNANVRTEDAADHPAAGDDAASRDDRVQRLAAAAPLFRKHELGRRCLWLGSP